MAELYCYTISPTKVVTLDVSGTPIFTAIYEHHLLHDTIITLYRGSEDSGDVLAEFKGSKVMFNGEEKKMREMVYGTSAWEE
jgi:hypothetical protein